MKRNAGALLPLLMSQNHKATHFSFKPSTSKQSLRSSGWQEKDEGLTGVQVIANLSRVSSARSLLYTRYSVRRRNEFVVLVLKLFHHRANFLSSLCVPNQLRIFLIRWKRKEGKYKLPELEYKEFPCVIVTQSISLRDSNAKQFAVWQ